jgi:hypothetical protein
VQSGVNVRSPRARARQRSRSKSRSCLSPDSRNRTIGADVRSVTPGATWGSAASRRGPYIDRTRLGCPSAADGRCVLARRVYRPVGEPSRVAGGIPAGSATTRAADFAPIAPRPYYPKAGLIGAQTATKSVLSRDGGSLAERARRTESVECVTLGPIGRTVRNLPWRDACCNVCGLR